MELRALKRLEREATPLPWRIKQDDKYSDSYGIESDGTCGLHPDEPFRRDDADLITTLRNLSPEIIALWQSVQVLCYPPADLPGTDLKQLVVVRENLDGLNSKLEDIA